MNSIEHFVDGKIFKGNSKKTGKVFNPATGEQTSVVKLGTTTDVNKAVEVAKKAFLTSSKNAFKFSFFVLHCQVAGNIEEVEIEATRR